MHSKINIICNGYWTILELDLLMTFTWLLSTKIAMQESTV